MNDVFNLSAFMQPESTQVDLLLTLINFLVCILMSFILRYFYISRSFSLTGKLHIGSIIPVLSAVVFLVIVVVKSSLALSLGLVGALSIVRFRTPIKEPEELVYLFLAIALGLGYGAGHTLLTTLLTILTLAMIYLWLSNRQQANTSEYNLIINWQASEVGFEQLRKVVEDACQDLRLIRLERGESGNSAVLLLTPGKQFNLDALLGNLQRDDPQLSLSFFEVKTNW